MKYHYLKLSSILVVASLLAPAVVAQQATTAPAKPFDPVEVSATLKAAKPGDAIQIHGLDLATLTKLPWTKTVLPNTPPLVFSDKPEYFRTGNGIALQEEVPAGRFRLYVYHVPEPTGETKIITATAENLSDQPATLTFHRYSFPAPGGDYHNMAKQSMAEFLAENPAPAAIAARTIAPKSRIVIDPAMEVPVKKDILVHGWYELESTQPLKITTFQRDLDADSLTVSDSLPKLPKQLPGFHASGAGRGVFPNTEFAITTPNDTSTGKPGVYDTASGNVQLVLADGTPTATQSAGWIEGKDSISGESGPANINKGNYGALYHIRIPYKSSDGRALALVAANARADGKWCKFAAMSVKVSDGLTPGGVVKLPAAKVRYEGLPEAVVVQTFAPTAGEGVIELTYTPPGASCLPQHFLLVPYNK